MFLRFSLSFSNFPFLYSVKCHKVYMTLSSREKHLFQKIIPWKTPLTTLHVLLKILGTGAWAVPHLTFWGDRPFSPSRFPPMALPKGTTFSKFSSDTF